MPRISDATTGAFLEAYKILLKYPTLRRRLEGARTGIHTSPEGRARAAAANTGLDTIEAILRRTEARTRGVWRFYLFATGTLIALFVAFGMLSIVGFVVTSQVVTGAVFAALTVTDAVAIFVTKPLDRLDKLAERLNRTDLAMAQLSNARRECRKIRDFDERTVCMTRAFERYFQLIDSARDSARGMSAEKASG